jgi:hypothetical protein
LPWVALFAPSGVPVSSTPSANLAEKAHAGPITASFHYHLSGLTIDYTFAASIDVGTTGFSRGSVLHVLLRFPQLSGTKHFRVGGFAPGVLVQVATMRREEQEKAEKELQTTTAAADQNGVVEFDALTGTQREIQLRQ